MNPQCARCGKVVYPTEKVNCLDKEGREDLENNRLARLSSALEDHRAELYGSSVKVFTRQGCDLRQPAWLYQGQIVPDQSGVPQGSGLGLMLFVIFINDIDSEIECALSKFADDTKVRGAVDTLGGWDASQRDLDKIEKWVHDNLMKLNKSNWKLLHLVWGNPRNEYKLEQKLTESRT
ncbi:hypothetical protein WISP_120250 [Willisornis vidua]|uniref:Reverse transcriptase domain-containing protein n=1 Tax=Willisornis vidua TaxID=1566151 RepID=A0ABQ9CVX4_9PASS|nr:hypothetical protein WISP_120250 [Willisornis vidua]